jgi:hypothetical protein
MLLTPGHSFLTDIVMLDIVGFSLLPDDRQYAAVVTVTATLRDTVSVLSTAGFRDKGDVVLGFIPTGDGFFVILNPTLAGYGVFLALGLRSAILRDDRRAKLGLTGIRAAAHFGAATPFLDINNQLNFVGSGLNSCARLTADKASNATLETFAGDKNFVVASEAALEVFERAYAKTGAEAWLGAIKWRQGASVTITDKHGLSYTACPIEASRYAAVRPPLPAQWARPPGL